MAFFIFKGIKNNTEKSSNLIKEISLFTLFFGILCFVISWLEALDTIVRVLEVASQVLAGGMKNSFYTPTFGLVIFLIGRLAAFLLLWNRK